MSRYILSYKDKYKGVYILTGKSRDEYHQNGKYLTKTAYVEVECPHCHNKRYVRETLLSDNNKNKMKSTLCVACSSSGVQIFEDMNNGISRTFVNNKEVIVDTEDVDKILALRDFTLQETDNYVAIVTRQNGRRKTRPLHNFIMNAKGRNVDHKNHNPLDCTKANLRVVTQQQNLANTFFYKTNITGFKNISLCSRKKKWFVQNKQIGLTKRFEFFPDAFKYYKENIEKLQNEYSYNLLYDKRIDLKYAGIIKDDVVNGTGVGLTLFVQNCTHHCDGCQNKSTWDPNGGSKFTIETWKNIVEYFTQNNYANHLTVSGGDPLDNLMLTNYVVPNFRYLFPNKKIWLYTGYTFEEVLKETKYLPVLESIDILVDGRFEKDKKDLTLHWKGSSNQRVIDVKKSLKANKPILYKES